MPVRIVPNAGYNVLVEVGFVCHGQEHTTDLQLRVDLTLDVPHRPHQFRHILRRQLVRLDGDKHIVQRRQGVNGQYTQRRTVVQQNIVIVPPNENALS